MGIVTVAELDESACPEWDRFVTTAGGAIFHTTVWRDILASEYGPQFSPRYLLARDARGSQTGALPIFLVSNLACRRLISLPCSTYGGPLWTGTDDVLQELLQGASRLSSDLRANGILIRGILRQPPSIVEKLGYHLYDPEVRSCISLEEGPHAVWIKSSKNSVRHSVKRGVREGLRTTISSSPKDLSVLHRLESLTRRKQGLPMPSLRYFLSILRTLGPERVKVMLAHHEEVPVAGRMVFVEGSSVLGVYAGSDPSYLRLRPNNFLLWKTIEWACGQGFRWLDLGPTLKANQGLLEYKRRWGSENRPVYQLHYPCRHSTAKSRTGLPFSLVHRFYSILPMPIFQAIGPKTIKHLSH